MKKYVQDDFLDKALFFMKWTSLLLALIITSAFAALAKPAAGQEVLLKKVTIQIKDLALPKALEQIARVTGVKFTYSGTVASSTVKVNADVKGAELKMVLDNILKNSPYRYEVFNDEIIIRYEPAKEKNMSNATGSQPVAAVDIRGKVIDENGQPLPGVTITVKGTQMILTSDANGYFIVQTLKDNVILVLTYVGYKTREIPATGHKEITIKLEQDFGKLDQVQIIGYGITTQRLSTGNVSSVKADAIAEQPVSNPLEALEGRVAGLSIIQSNGMPGSNVNVQIRGQNSITSGTNPLYIVDGVPYPSVSLDFIYGANAPAYGGVSTFNSINPSDIESIEILKDADETAIYGSRGANGVILISTKQGKTGKTKLDVNISTGAGEVTRMMKLLSPDQYYSLREQAFANDNVTPTDVTAPDLLKWNKSQTTDFEKLLIGNTAHTTDANVSLSGGNESTTFLLSSNYHHETTVFPGDLGYGRGGLHLNVAHKSLDKKFSLNLSASYLSDVNNLNSTDLTRFYNLPSDYPLYTTGGALNWEAGLNNPLAFLQQPYRSATDNLISGLVLQYTVFAGFNIKVNLGYNKLAINQVETMPSTSQNPAFNPTGSANFVTNTTSTYLIEPQIDYKHQFGKATISALAGSTLQSTSGNLVLIDAYNYATDALLQSAGAAGGSFNYNFNSLYRYESVYGRLNINWDGKYIINGNFRRDGSSRFGPGRQYGNFGSVGAGWLFSEEKVIKNSLPWLSFGKLRASYGTVGNDQIPDYGYLSQYYSTTYPYGGAPGLHPAGLANPDFSWEVNKKLEFGLELGFLKDRVLLTTAIYRDRSDNQILGGNLPSQTGFNNFTANIPAEILNTGLEFELNTVNVKNKKFSWSSAFNLTILKNKLVAWPGLASSFNANYYVIGQPLTPFIKFHSTGVNPQTGVPSVADINHDGQINYGLASTGGDQVVAGSIFPDFYGGFSNKITYKNLQLDFLFQFVKQKGLSILSRTSNPPGTIYNTYAGVTARWQKPGDVSNIPAATATAGTDAYNAYNYYFQSDAALGDASFIRLKTLSLSYNLTGEWVHRLKIQQLKLYLHGQNLLTFTHYLGFDPENAAQIGIPILPPLKMLTAGLQCTF